MSTWFFGVLSALVFLRVLGCIYIIDRPREPLSRGDVVWLTVSHALVIAGLIYFGILGA